MQPTVRICAILGLFEQRVWIRAAIQYARLAAEDSSDGLGLPDSRKAINIVLVFMYASSSTDLILFEQIQRHYHEANTTSLGWNRLEYSALTPSGRGSKDKIHLIDRKTVYPHDLAIAWREPQQVRQGQRQGVGIKATYWGMRHTNR